MIYRQNYIKSLLNYFCVIDLSIKFLCVTTAPLNYQTCASLVFFNSVNV